MFGREHKSTSKQLISAKKIKTYQITTSDGTIIILTGLNACAEYFGLNSKQAFLYQCSSGKFKLEKLN